MQNNELNEENEHIKFWEICLNDLIKQFEIMNEFIFLTKKYEVQKSSDLSYILNKYRNDTKQFTKEPSHIYYLCEIFFDFQSCFWGIMNKSTNELYNKINSMNIDIIKDIEKTKNESNKTNFLLMNECQKLIQKIKTQENEFYKIKNSMDNAQINQNKIKNKVKKTYNVTEIKKADLILAEQIRKMEEIKIPMEENKKKLKEFRNTLNSSIKESFEKVLFIYFKHLANLHQYFFLLSSNKLELITDMKKKVVTSLLQLSNLSFDLNDYTEKKFGELIGIKFDGIIMFDSEELLNKSSSKLLIKISYDIINYIQVFMICLRYRKKIMKIFYEAIKGIMKFEENYKKNFDNSYKNLINQLNSIKNISDEISRNWKRLFNSTKTKENNYFKTILLEIDKYINSARNEYNKFKNNWNEYENKIKEKQKDIIDFLKEKNNIKLDKLDIKEINEKNNIKDDKLREVIKSSINFINNNVYELRERDKKEMGKLSLIFEKLLQKFRNGLNKEIDITEEEISNSANLDIFEECKIIILKYFNNFNIKNYDNFLEKMKVKLLLKTQLQNEKLGKDVIEKLNDKFMSKENFIDSKISNFDDSQSQILPENDVNISELKKINNMFFDTKNNIIPQNLFSEKNNNKNANKTGDMISYNNIFQKKNGNNNSEIENVIEKEYEINKYEELDESLDLLNKNKFTELTKIENPYKNIKEDELKRLKLITLNKNLNYNELEEGEKRIDSFNCALKDKILLQGKLNITTKKIEFNSLFNNVTFFGKTIIIIPLKDIIEIEKKYNLGLDNSIIIKTENISYFFTNFLSRDRCYNLLQEQLNQIKEKETNKNKTVEIKKQMSPEELYLKKKRFKSKQISKMLEDINFYLRLNQITKERLALFSKKYKDEKNCIFLPDEKFSKKFFEHIFESCPLYICFKYICNISTQLDELGYSKGFFESILIENISKEIIMIEKEENNNENTNIPEYFDNGDYVMDLFCSFNKNEFENLLNDAQNWPHKYEYYCYGTNQNKSKKNEKADLFIVYFVSPILLIFDIIGYSSGINYFYNFIPLFRYRFDSSIKFNKNKGKFDFITKLTVLFEIIFLPNYIINNGTNKIYEENEQIFKNKILNKLMNILNNYIEIFSDIYEKMTEETFQKKIKLKQNMITGEYEEENIEELTEDLELSQSNSNIIFNKDEIDNIENMNLDDIINENSETNIKNSKNDNDKIKEEKKDSNKNINNNNNNINNENKSKIGKKEKIFFIIIIIILIGIIISLLFSKSEKKKIDYNIIINLISLCVIIYLLRNK